MKKTIKNFRKTQNDFQMLYMEQTDPICQKYGLTEIEFSVLMFVYQNPDQNRAADVVKGRGYSKSYVSIAVKALTERGLLEGKKTETDRKNIHLHLTPAGEEICVDGARAEKDYLALLMNGFEKEEAELFFAYFERVSKNVKDAREKKLSEKKKKKKG